MNQLGLLATLLQISLLIFVMGMTYKLHAWFKAAPLRRSSSRKLSFGEWAWVFFNSFLDLILMRRYFKYGPILLDSLALGALVFALNIMRLSVWTGHAIYFGLVPIEVLIYEYIIALFKLIVKLAPWLATILISILFIRRLVLNYARAVVTLNDVFTFTLLILMIVSGALMELVSLSSEPLPWQVLPGLTLTLSHTPDPTFFLLFIISSSIFVAYFPFSPFFSIFPGVLSSILRYKRQVELAEVPP